MGKRKVQGIRIVWRVADMQFTPWLGLAVEACSRCGQPVYVETTQPVPPGIAYSILVCVPCGLLDDKIRPEIARIHRNVRAATAAFTPR